MTVLDSARRPRAMRRFMVVVLVAGALGVVDACGSREQPAFRPTSTIKDIMDSMVDPSADILWESVATIITLDGTEEKAPQTDDEWKTVRRAAVRVIEATNLVQMAGRQVARPGEKAENENIELAPEAIQALIDRDRTSWVTLAHGLHDAATEALKAIDARDPQRLSNAGEGLDRACENCHLKYWYPPGKGPANVSTR